MVRKEHRLDGAQYHAELRASTGGLTMRPPRTRENAVSVQTANKCIGREMGAKRPEPPSNFIPQLF